MKNINRKFVQQGKKTLSIALLVLLIVLTSTNIYSHATPSDFQERHIEFTSGDIVLSGSLFLPNVKGPHPVVILIHGAGHHTREEYRAKAEIFVKSGIVAFIYDKRTIGYSADGIGENSRSYAMLANDVLAAVEALYSIEEIDQENIGLWGLSEGSSVGPLAAVQSDKIAFVITVSPSGVAPAQQTSWAMENEFRHQGITSKSFIHSMTRAGMHFLVSVGMFAEATYDHIPPLEQLEQPILAILGNNDRTAPPAESYEIMKGALDRGGNKQYTFQFIPNADHNLRKSLDGVTSSNEFAIGYPEAMTSWIHDVVKGNPYESKTLGEIPEQEYKSSNRVVENAWYDSVWLQLGVFLLLINIFSSYFITTLFSMFKRRKISRNHKRLRNNARITAILGDSTIVGFFGYFGYVMLTNNPGPVFIGRPLFWLLLQLLALTTCLLTILLTFSFRSNRSLLSRIEKVQIGLVLFGGILFIPWAFYWQLLFL